MVTVAAFGSPRYRSGTRGYMKAVVLDLLRRYLSVEHHFQQGKGCRAPLGSATGSGQSKGEGPASPSWVSRLPHSPL